MRRTGWVVALVVACAWGTVFGAEYYAAPDGRSAGKGTKADPLDLATAIGPGSPARPGDTIYLRAGTYRDGLASTVRGQRGKPVTIRAVPGERATIDCRARGTDDRPTLLSVNGDWTVLWGLEITCSDPGRVTRIKGSHPPDIRRGGLTSRASHVTFINLAVHDCSNGFGFWSGGEGGEIYGCLIYNNGWIGPDRGHGHAIYAQNKTGTKRLIDNVMFNQFSYGVHCYGSSRAFLRGFHLEGNVSFHNGSAARADSRTPAILIGGGCPAERISVVSNYTYGDSRHGGGTVQLGYSGRPNKDATVRDNYFVGQVNVRLWERVRFEGNTLIGMGSLLRLDVPKGVGVGTYEWDRNTYVHRVGSSPPFALRRDGQGGSITWAQWRKEGLDAHGRFLGSKPTGANVFVRPNRYEPGRAHVIVYNWDRKAAVNADLRKVLRTGQEFRIVSAQDFFGEPVVMGTYDGRGVRIPMTACRAVRPIGMPNHETPVTGPEFNVFIVLPGR